MKVSPDAHRRRQRSSVFVALLLFNLVLVILQLWLFVSILESALDGDSQFAIPKAAISFVILGVNLWMLKGIYRMEVKG